MTTWDRIAKEAADFPHDVREMPIVPHVTAKEIRDDLERRYSFDAPQNGDDVVADVMAMLRKWTAHVTSPRYFGLFNPTVRPIAVAAEALAALYNPQIAVWTHAPGAAEMERRALDHFMTLFGWDPVTSIGNFTSGGAEANLSATLAAIARHFPETAELGMTSAHARPAIYLTTESHHSFVKIARMTGLGTESLREVATTADGTMDVEILARTIAIERKVGWEPLMIVATAGTTGAGLIDPIPAIADVAKEVDCWLHVDAAWGGAAILSPRLRPLLAGIERAHSVTWDAHKWLSVSMGAGMFFCRDVEAVKHAFAVTTSYMPPRSQGDGVVDAHISTVQWSRRAIGLKVFMALAELGTDGYAALIDHQTEMGELIRKRVTGEGWIVTNRTELPVICFTHPDIRSGRTTTTDILKTIDVSNRVWISDVAFGGERVLRACVTSYETNEGDVEVLVEELAAALKVATS